ncbi:hypothetical protein TcWFU_006985 [Taenia crassiceps]|uniref:Uncharacterized protein n=1 Tax=Taenia crassiceps TaxID=6207 RepID=A0ABR4Q8B5_9CEST
MLASLEPGLTGGGPVDVSQWPPHRLQLSYARYRRGGRCCKSLASRQPFEEIKQDLRCRDGGGALRPSEAENALSTYRRTEGPLKWLESHYEPQRSA